MLYDLRCSQKCILFGNVMSPWFIVHVEGFSAFIPAKIVNVEEILKGKRRLESGTNWKDFTGEETELLKMSTLATENFQL